MQFALPCSCGNSVPVQQSQAGATVVCSQCGKTLNVPTIRGLRSLEAIPETEGATASDALQRKQWNPIRGVLAIFVWGRCVYTLWPAGEWWWFRLNSDFSITLDDELKAGEKIVEELTPFRHGTLGSSIKK